MSVGPLRRSVGALGLLALVPLAAMLATGTLAPVDAARRAVVTFVALVVLGRLAGAGMRYLAGALERTATTGGTDAGEPVTTEAAQT